MATFKFTPRPRKKKGNEPLTYDITEITSPLCSEAGPVPGAKTSAGTLVKQKNKWRLRWRGITAEFDTRIQLQRHFALLGHRIEGLA